ncbi:GNAT family N-acetyltransferase [Fictibacillus barbaricus]|uniref:GNAT family N-acetyltransferase n=1 Tax=Fictibacillus barbaricus TaxID=182136 RepID=A0ABS2ZIS8_9BACL|nr:GNAT family N-acetyltransferase [Fictibacillus barbaricus]MBN3547337.1 GNAT family N-acetyltransferase [Fictibacillus barbaricus]GGB48249.1 putative N-acetyltransferase YkwB [Fictibacillus barbaricus]
MYKKEQYLYANGKHLKAVIRNYNKDDFMELISIQKESFPPPFPSDLWWNENQLSNHTSLFPEGALCVEIDGILAGSVTGLIVNFDLEHPDHSWEEITDNGYIKNHDRDGDTLYIVDICVRPSYRKLDLGKLLMQSMYETVVHLKLSRLLGGGRMPGFYKHAQDLTPEEYIEKVVSGELRDPVISFLLRCGRTPLVLVPDYLVDDESCNYALLMEWRNPFLKST